MDSKDQLVLSCETLSTNRSTRGPKKQRYGEESSCSDYIMYPSEPLKSREYVNYYDSCKIDVLEELKKEFPEDECPQSVCSMNSKIVSENAELLMHKDYQKVIIKNTGEEFSLNLTDSNKNGNYQFTVKTETLEKQDAWDNSGATSLHYDDIIAPQDVKFSVTSQPLKPPPIKGKAPVKGQQEYRIRKKKLKEAQNIHKGKPVKKNRTEYQREYRLKQKIMQKAKQDVLIKNTGEEFSLNLMDANRNGNNPFTIKTETLEEQDVWDNSGATSLHNDGIEAPQDVKFFSLLKHNDEQTQTEINTSANNELLHQCQYCDKVFYNHYNMLAHVSDVHSKELCEKPFNSVSNHNGLLFSPEFKNLPNQVTPNDMKCNVDFQGDYRQNNQIKLSCTAKEDKGMQYICDSCGGVYKNKHCLKLHKKRMHLHYGTMFTCWCGKQFRTPIHLTVHKRIWHPNNKIGDLYKCDHCEAVYKAKVMLTKHVKTKHYDCGGTFDCWCGKYFLSLKSLRAHMKRHEGKVRQIKYDIVECDYCQKTYKTKSNLLAHIQNVHCYDDRLFECCCGKQFRSRQYLRNHMRRHTMALN